MYLVESNTKQNRTQNLTTLESPRCLVIFDYDRTITVPQIHTQGQWDFKDYEKNLKEIIPYFDELKNLSLRNSNVQIGFASLGANWLRVFCSGIEMLGASHFFLESFSLHNFLKNKETLSPKKMDLMLNQPAQLYNYILSGDLDDALGNEFSNDEKGWIRQYRAQKDDQYKVAWQNYTPVESIIPQDKIKKRYGKDSLDGTLDEKIKNNILIEKNLHYFRTLLNYLDKFSVGPDYLIVIDDDKDKLRDLHLLLDFMRDIPQFKNLQIIAYHANENILVEQQNNFLQLPLSSTWNLKLVDECINKIHRNQLNEFFSSSPHESKEMKSEASLTESDLKHILNEIKRVEENQTTKDDILKGILQQSSFNISWQDELGEHLYEISSDSIKEKTLTLESREFNYTLILYASTDDFRIFPYKDKEGHYHLQIIDGYDSDPRIPGKPWPVKVNNLESVFSKLVELGFVKNLPSENKNENQISNSEQLKRIARELINKSKITSQPKANQEQSLEAFSQFRIEEPEIEKAREISLIEIHKKEVGDLEEAMRLSLQYVPPTTITSNSMFNKPLNPILNIYEEKTFSVARDVAKNKRIQEAKAYFPHLTEEQREFLPKHLTADSPDDEFKEWIETVLSMKENKNLNKPNPADVIMEPAHNDLDPINENEEWGVLDYEPTSPKFG